MDYTYVPSEGSCFSGKVVLEIGTYQERLEILAEMSGMTDAPDMKGKLSAAKKQYEICSKRVKSVDLEHKNGMKFERLDILSCYAEGAEMINELAGIIVNGPSLGNSSPSNSKKQ